LKHGTEIPLYKGIEKSRDHWKNSKQLTVNDVGQEEQMESAGD